MALRAKNRFALLLGLVTLLAIVAAVVAFEKPLREQ